MGISDCDLTGETEAVRLDCARVEATILPVLGVTPLVGRNFSADEDRDGTPDVALISYACGQADLRRRITWSAAG